MARFPVIRGESVGLRCARRALSLLTAGLLLGLGGCSGGAPTKGAQVPPSLAPSTAAAAALAEYDANKDGALDAGELERCPALKGALARIDKNGDGRLSAEEVANRLTFFKSQNLLTSAQIEVTLDGRPLAGARVALVPEKFMGGGYKPAAATTDDAGTALLQTEGASDVAIAAGYYRVEVSKKDAKGQETIPSKFNVRTTLGQEVVPAGSGRESGAVRIRLSSR